jgi:cytochrome P450
MTVSQNQSAIIDALPPGPRLPRLVQTALFLRYPYRWLPALHRRFGDVFTVRILQLGTVVVLGNVEHIRTVFTGSPTVFHAGESNEVNRSVVGDQSVVLLDEGHHQRIRRLLTPAFNGAALRGYQDLFRELAVAHVETWPQGRPFSMQHQIEEHTLEIILRVVFGVADPDRLAKLRPPITRVVRMTFTDMLGLVFPPLQRIEPWRRYRAALQQAHRLLDAEIAAAGDPADLTDRNDVLARLLSHAGADGDGLSRAELRDQAMTLLLAGHHTTATSLAWTFHELARHPEQLREAQRAADEGDDAYLEAVVKEAIRLHPALHEVVRRLTKEIEIGGYRLPPGVTVAPAIGIVQSSPDYHPEPSQFRPQRLIDQAVQPGTWIPFGGGARRCPGAGFAVAEAVAVLKAALTRYDISADRPEPESPKARNILMVPNRGARVVVTARRDRERSTR